MRTPPGFLAERILRRHHAVIAGRLLWTCVCGALFAPPLAAQNALASAKSLTCVFPIFVVGTWKNGEPAAELKKSNFSVRFDSINLEEGSAVSAGLTGTSAGAPYLTVRLAGDSLHFTASGSAGAVYVTTVFNKETKDKALQAVHSRHEFTPISLPGFTSRPEQYYGECKISE